MTARLNGNLPVWLCMIAAFVSTASAVTATVVSWPVLAAARDDARKALNDSRDNERSILILEGRYQALTEITGTLVSENAKWASENGRWTEAVRSVQAAIDGGAKGDAMKALRWFRDSMRLVALLIAVIPTAAVAGILTGRPAWTGINVLGSPFGMAISTAAAIFGLLYCVLVLDARLSRLERALKQKPPIVWLLGAALLLCAGLMAVSSVLHLSDAVTLVTTDAFKVLVGAVLMAVGSQKER